MSGMTSFPLPRLLADHWGLPDAEITAHEGGMTSQTWIVRQGGARWLAKAVDAERYGRSFTSGLAAATRVTAAGIPAGEPLVTLDGTSTVELDGRSVALLSWVDGDPIDVRTPEEMRVIGRTLAGAHLALGKVPPRPARPTHPDRPTHTVCPAHSGRPHIEPLIEPDIDPAGLHLGVRPWIRPAIAKARAAVEALNPSTLTWGPLHGDPSPESFFRDSTTGTIGLIDWGAHTTGPRVFDLASAVMYAGGIAAAQPLIGAYIAEGAVPTDEVERALPALLDWRWAIQASYFAYRIAANDMTGVTDPADNEQGLADAKAHLAPPVIRSYEPPDEPEWIRCRAVAFLGTCYYDAVEPRKPVEDEADAVIDLIAVDGDRVVAILDVAVRGDLATIETICVEPEYRRFGLATRLLNEAFARLVGTPARTLDAWTREDPEPLAWYTASGFVEEYTYIHVYSGYGSANTARITDRREPYGPVIVFAHTLREHEEQARAEFDRVYVCRRFMQPLP